MDFERDIFPFDDIPHIITIRPILRAGQRSRPPSASVIARGIAEQLQVAVVQSTQRFRAWTVQRILDLHGGLNAFNTDNNGNHSYDEIIQLRDINQNMILDIFSNIQQSNHALGIYDVEWVFTIPRMSFIRGGRSTIVPVWARKLHFKDTWEDHGVNCAAYALIRLLETKKRHPRDLTRSKKFFIQESRELCQELNWSDDISIAELSTFVKKYPKYCICVLVAPRTKGIPIYGSRFTDKENILYLFYDDSQEHFAACQSKTAILNSSPFSKDVMAWCDECFLAYTKTKGHSECDIPPKSLKRNTCECGMVYTGKHLCYHRKCSHCNTFYKTEIAHRCPLFYNERSEKKNTWMTDNPNGEYPALIAYDFESRFEFMDTGMTKQLIQGFVRDEDEHLTGEITTRDCIMQRHVVDLVRAKVCFTGQEVMFNGETPVKDFINWLFEFNNGNAYVYAHNGSGYDTRLVFSELQKRFYDRVPQPIMRGGKIMRLTIGKLVFGDTMLHLPGSLKALAKSFKSKTLKGYFPYLFNTLENKSYIGTIPALTHFDASGQKTVHDYKKLKAWYATNEAVQYMKIRLGLDPRGYNLEKEKDAYCRDDVKILAFILEEHHKSMMLLYGLTPWVKPTTPGYITEVIGIELTKKWRAMLPDPDHGTYYDALQDLALNKSWTALTQWEYQTIHSSLRGGRTEVKCMYRELSTTERLRGCKIVYVDVVSLYPYQQVVHPNFVGTPIVHYWDEKYRPCYKHPLGCLCGGGDKLTESRLVKQRWSIEKIKTVTGIFVITLIPPKNLIHPVLNLWNEKMNKCIPTLRDEDHVEITIDHVSLRDCINAGYSVVHVHCFLEFKCVESLWRDPTLRGVVEKTINSEEAPENKEEFLQAWDTKFPGVRKMFEDRWDRWGDNPALRNGAKTMTNSVWGKHAERANLPSTEIFDFRKDRDKIDTLWINIMKRNLKFLSAQAFNRDNGTICYKTEKRNAKLDLHKGYLPAALMIPAYGRSQLWNEMNKLGERVLMCDTDSIIYVYDPSPGVYNVKTGTMLGEWEEEKVSIIGIQEFVGWGPKTYALKLANGTELVKAKGISLSYGTNKLFNFEIMKREVLSFINTGKMESIFIPQFNFEWSIIKEMTTNYHLKEAKINKEDLKGKLYGSYLYPFGYERSDSHT